jgi:hypothetical protein
MKKLWLAGGMVTLKYEEMPNMWRMIFTYTQSCNSWIYYVDKCLAQTKQQAFMVAKNDLSLEIA